MYYHLPKALLHTGHPMPFTSLQCAVRLGCVAANIMAAWGCGEFHVAVGA